MNTPIEIAAFEKAFISRLGQLKILLEQIQYLDKGLSLEYSAKMSDLLIEVMFVTTDVDDKHTMLRLGKLPTDFQKGRDYFSVIDKQINDWCDKAIDFHQKGTQARIKERRKHYLVVGILGALAIISLIANFFV